MTSSARITTKKTMKRALARTISRKRNQTGTWDSPTGACTARTWGLFLVWRTRYRRGGGLRPAPHTAPSIPTRKSREVVMASAGAEVGLRGMMRWRGLEPPRGVNPTRPSTLRVYQFRHQRAPAIVARVETTAALSLSRALLGSAHRGWPKSPRRKIVMPRAARRTLRRFLARLPIPPPARGRNCSHGQTKVVRR